MRVGDLVTETKKLPPRSTVKRNINRTGVVLERGTWLQGNRPRQGYLVLLENEREPRFFLRSDIRYVQTLSVEELLTFGGHPKLKEIALGKNASKE